MDMGSDGSPRKRLRAGLLQKCCAILNAKRRRGSRDVLDLDHMAPTIGRKSQPVQPFDANRKPGSVLPSPSRVSADASSGFFLRGRPGRRFTGASPSVSDAFTP